MEINLNLIKDNIIMRYSLAVPFLIATLLFISAAQAQVYISSCSASPIVNSNQIYYVTQDISGSAYCILFTNSNNITVDCQNHVLTGINTTGSIGILLNNMNNSVVRNCNVSGWFAGIAGAGASNNLLFTNDVAYNMTNYLGAGMAFTVGGVTNSAISNSILYNNIASAIVLNNVSSCNVINNTVSYGGFLGVTGGISFMNYTRNSLAENNTVYNETGGGILFNSGSHDNIMRNNTVYNESSTCLALTTLGIFNADTYNNIVENNTVYNCNVGLQLFSGNYNNYNSTIRYNKFYNINYVGGGAVYFNTYAPTGTPAPISNITIYGNNFTVSQGTSTAVFETTGGSPNGAVQGILAYNNYIYGDTSLFIGPIISSSNFNITKSFGSNIINRSNPYIGGNYWDNSTGGYSGNCVDSNTDGFCDISYTIKSYNGSTQTDYIPLSNKYNPIPPPCTCGSWTSGSCFNDTYRTQTRSCSPSLCNIETQYVYDASCIPCICGNWVTAICNNATARMQYRTCNPNLCNITTQYINDSSCAPPPEVSTFFNSQLIVAVIVIAISGGIAFYVGGDYAWVVFVTMSGMLFLMFSIIGVYPKWIIVLAIIAVAGAFLKLIMDAMGK